MDSGTPILPSIQAMRAVAALMVVCLHAQLDVGQFFGGPRVLPSLSLGEAGVDIFFVISGFVMVASSWNSFGRRQSGVFLMRRAIRIVPLYWLGTGFYVALAWLTAPAGATYPTKWIVWSLLFWPFARPGGIVQPIHVVGWTLNYEMFFYVLFAGALAAPRHLAIAGLTAALTLIVAAAALYPPHAVVLRFWADPIILEFAGGMLLGAVYCSGRRLSVSRCAVLAAAALLALAGSPYWVVGEVPRVLSMGLPALILVAAAVLPRNELRAPQALIALGNASYALYLVHLPVFLVVRIVGSHLPVRLEGATAAWLAFVILLSSSVAAALFLHRWMERPATTWLKAALPKRLGAAAAPRPSHEVRPGPVTA